jgi:hypothetical protein
MPETIDLFNPARAPYTDTDLFGIGYGAAPTPTYGGTLLNLFTYIAKKTGTGQITLIGNSSYTMLSTDFELASSAALTLSPTWTLVPANSLPAGSRRRIVDLAGVIVPGTYQIQLGPAGTDKINGANAVYSMYSRFAYIVLETDGVSNWTIVESGPNLRIPNNLSDLSNIVTARTNLGLGTAAVHNIADFLQSSNNLSELVPSASIARANLALGALAVLNTVLYSNLDPTMIATAADVASGTPNKLVPANLVSTSKAPVAFPPLAGGSAAWNFGTFVNATCGHTASTTISASNISPGQVGFIIFNNAKTGGYSPAMTWPSSFNFMSTTTTLSATFGAIDMLEYFAQSASIIHCRLTKAI